MTDEPLVPSVAPEDQAPQAAAPMPTAGQMIKEARLASGLHIGTLSNTLKVPVKKLEALEADDWQTPPEMVFVRALATSVCRQINIDSAPVLEA
jgi:cytoskeleton protein RodZ